MRLTPDYIESQVESVEYTYSGTLTIATVTTKSGTKLVGHSACLDPKNYDREVGEQIARKNAVEQLWALEGYVFRKFGLHELPGDTSSIESLMVLIPKVAAPSVGDTRQLAVVSGRVQEAHRERLKQALASLGADSWALLPADTEVQVHKA